MSKILIYLLPSVLAILLVTNDCCAQQSNKIERTDGFKIQLITGTNMSQLEGDNLNGYTLIGLRAGAQINYALSAKRGLALGLFYDEKGSSASFSLLSNQNKQITKLRYLSIPVDFYLDSAYRPEIEKHRIRLQMGVSISRLFSAKSEHEILRNYTNAFSTFDIAPNIGLTYSISRKSGLNLRFESSITTILKENLALDLQNLRSYLFSVQYVYSL